MDPYQSRQSDYLGVNKMGRNIRKSPIHQPSFASSKQQPQPQLPPQSQPQPQPHVYNINKNDFRELVQQLTGSPLRDPPSRPPQSTPRQPNNRLQRIRPPPLPPTHRPQVPVYPAMAPLPAQPYPQPHPMVPPPFSNSFVRRPLAQPEQPSPGIGLPPTPTDVWTNTAESPISVYMKYLQNSIMNSSPRQPQGIMQAQVPQNMNSHQPPLFPPPAMPQFPLARANGLPPPFPSPRYNAFPPPATVINGALSSAPPPPPMNVSAPAPAPAAPFVPAVSPAGPNMPPFLPSPTSQFLLNSPTGLWNVLSPRSPYPLLSPGYQFPPPLSPGFSFASLGQSGALGGPSHTPPSPGYGFSPLSPSSFFPISSPRWRNP